MGEEALIIVYSHDEAKMQDVPERVDFLSELIALSTYANTKNIIISAMEVTGPVDVEAYTQATRLASKSFPKLISCLKETRIWGRHYLIWEHRPDVPVPVLITDLPQAERSGPLLDSIMKLLRPRLERNWNLFEEVAVEIHLIRLHNEHYVIAHICHHVAADAGTAAEFGKEIIMHYHEIMRGQKPDWANEGHAISSSRKRAVRVHKNGWKEAMVNSHRGIMKMFEKPALPLGRGRSGDMAQHFPKRILSEEQTALAIRSASQTGVSLIDTLTACSNLAIDTWNAERNLAPGILTTAMTVNTRGRFRGFETPNNSSVIFFRSLPEERKDPSAFFRSLARMRMRYFREQQDLTSMHNVRRMIQILRFFPFRMRRRIVNFVLNRHRFSLAVTWLGAVWPKIVNGRPTGDSSITSSADFCIQEIHGFGYKLHSGTRLVLFVYVFRNQINLILVGSASLFTREETEAFMDLIMGKLLGNGLK